MSQFHEIFAYSKGRLYLKFIQGKIKLYSASKKLIASSTHHMEMFTSFEKIFIARFTSAEDIAADLLRMEINDMIDEHIGFHTGWDFVMARVLNIDDIKRITTIGEEYEFKTGIGWPDQTPKTHRGILIGYDMRENFGCTPCLLDNTLICNGMAYVMKTNKHDRLTICPFVALTCKSTLTPLNLNNV